MGLRVGLRVGLRWVSRWVGLEVGGVAGGGWGSLEVGGGSWRWLGLDGWVVKRGWVGLRWV